MGNDTRLSDARTPTTHTHSYQAADADLLAIGGLTGTSGFLKKTAADTWSLDTATYAATTHVHAISDVTALQTALDAKAQTSANNTWTGTNNFSASVREKKIDLASGTVIDLNLGNVFTRTISGATTLSVSNTPATSIVASFLLELTNGGANITYWASAKWAGGTKPVLTTAGKDVLGFYTHDGGATWIGLVLAKDVK
jgi:hypothetical protein